MLEGNFFKNHLLCLQFSFKLSYANCFLKQYVTKCILRHSISIKGNYFKHSVDFSFSLKFASPCLYFKSILQSIKAITLGLGNSYWINVKSCKIEDDSPEWLWILITLEPHTSLGTWQSGLEDGKAASTFDWIVPDQHIYGLTYVRNLRLSCADAHLTSYSEQIMSYT